MGIHLCVWVHVYGHLLGCYTLLIYFYYSNKVDCNNFCQFILSFVEGQTFESPFHYSDICQLILFEVKGKFGHVYLKNKSYQHKSFFFRNSKKM